MPYGQGRGTAWGQGRAASLGVVLHWFDFFGGVPTLWEMTTEADLEEGLKTRRRNFNRGSGSQCQKVTKSTFRFISSKQWVRINFVIFTTRSNNNPLEDLNFFFNRFVPKYIVAWNRQLPYYTANKKCDLIQSYLWFKIREDSHPILPCYSM